MACGLTAATPLVKVLLNNLLRELCSHGSVLCSCRRHGVVTGINAACNSTCRWTSGTLSRRRGGTRCGWETRACNALGMGHCNLCSCALSVLWRLCLWFYVSRPCRETSANSQVKLTHTCTHICICTHIHMHAHTHTCMHTHTHTHIRTHVHSNCNNSHRQPHRHFCVTMWTPLSSTSTPR